MGTTAHHYVAPARRDDVLRHVAAECGPWPTPPQPARTPSSSPPPAYLGYGEGDAAFAANARSAGGTVRLEGLESTITSRGRRPALTSVNKMTNDDTLQKETTKTEFLLLLHTPRNGLGSALPTTSTNSQLNLPCFSLPPPIPLPSS